MARRLTPVEKANKCLMQRKRYQEKTKACLPKGAEYIGTNFVKFQPDGSEKIKNFLQVFYKYQGKEFNAFIALRSGR